MEQDTKCLVAFTETQLSKLGEVLGLYHHHLQTGMPLTQRECDELLPAVEELMVIVVAAIVPR